MDPYYVLRSDVIMLIHIACIEAEQYFLFVNYFPDGYILGGNVKYCPPFLLCFAFFRLFVPAGFARLSIVFTSAVYRCQLLGYVEFWQRMNGSHDLTVQFELPLYIFFRCC